MKNIRQGRKREEMTESKEESDGDWEWERRLKTTKRK